MSCNLKAMASRCAGNQPLIWWTLLEVIRKKIGGTNGELYGFEKQKADLKQKGYTFKIDGLISTSFEQLARGTISEERFKIFCDKYEAEQKELTKFVSETETEIQTAKRSLQLWKKFATIPRKWRKTKERVCRI